jgi:hypothetical protein
MTKRISAGDDHAQPATSRAGTEAAAEVGLGTTNNGSGLDAEVDDYDELLAALGRTEDDDFRISIHESGHATAARLLGREVGGVTVNPDPVRGYEGLCWGVGHTEAFAEGRGNASDVREALAPLMPAPGEDHSSVSDVFGNVYSQCIELMAGRAAERMLLSDDDTLPAGDDHRQARELALLICRSEQAIDAFISHCDVAAGDLLMPYGDVVMVLSIVLRIKRTLEGPEIDEIISDAEARKAMAVEHSRRADWRAREMSARAFRQNVITPAAASLPDCPQDRRT